MDVLSPSIFLRIILIFRLLFPFALWILIPWVPVLFCLTSFSYIPQVSVGLLIVSSFFCAILCNAAAYILCAAHLCQAGGHTCSGMCLVPFSECVGLVGDDAGCDMLIAGLLRSMLPTFPACYLLLEVIPHVSAPSIAPICKRYSFLSSLVSNGERGMGLFVLPGCFTAVPQLSLSCPLCHLVLASIVSGHGASFIFLPCSAAVLLVGSLRCSGLCFPLIQELANCGQ